MSAADNDRDKPVHEVLDGAKSVDLGRSKPVATVGFDVEELNERYAMVIIGGRPAILDENWKQNGRDLTPVHERIRFLSPDAFEKWLANRIHLVGEKQFTAAQLWMRHPARRQYQGLTFDPSLPPGGADVGGYYNLWQGFTVEPNPHASCDIFLDHIRTNVANGNEGHAAFILGTLADMLQNPTDRNGIALVLRGRMGTGKTVVGYHVGRLFEANYALVDDPRYIVGNFNAHLASLLLLQADEGFWAGDKTAEGRLKGLVTSETQMIEMKGKDPIQVRNFVHLMVTSNADWVVPASHEERRFAVFDVGDHCIQNHEYFGNMAAELQAGGYGALLHLLQTFDTRPIDLRRIPSTGALYEQKIASLSPVEHWWLACLQQGWIVQQGAGTESGEEASEDDWWIAEVEIERVYGSYIAHCERMGVRHRKPVTQFGIEIRKIEKSLMRGRRSSGARRPYVYRLPTLEACRQAFEARIGMPLDWDADMPLSTASRSDRDV